MAQKEDILEQIVEEYLTHKGYFVRHNVKYRPKTFNQTQSDIDVLGYNPHLAGPERVLIVNCKSWQGGFSFQSQLKIAETEKGKLKYRELLLPDWSQAFCETVKSITGEDTFTYVLAVTRAVGDSSLWTDNENYRKALNGNPIRVLTLKEMVTYIERELTRITDGKRTRAPASTDIGRTLQLFMAAGLHPEPAPPIEDLDEDD